MGRGHILYSTLLPVLGQHRQGHSGPRAPGSWAAREPSPGSSHGHVMESPSWDEGQPSSPRVQVGHAGTFRRGRGLCNRDFREPAPIRPSSLSSRWSLCCRVGWRWGCVLSCKGHFPGSLSGRVAQDRIPSSSQGGFFFFPLAGREVRSGMEKETPGKLLKGKAL